MPVNSVAEVLAFLRQLQLVKPERIDELAQKLEGKPIEARALGQKLIDAGWLTAYQVNQVLQGRGKNLLLGSYLLLERLGEGGMGEVFKARHKRLERIVALKLVHKERLDNPQAVKRFRREIEAAAKLNHPNIVVAYDADDVNGTHFFTMEFVDGTDLNKLVKEKGPLPVDHACDCIRQTALGLQHAFEKGLVHRDIKPHNLLFSKTGMVKILDMGLARAQASEDSSTLTQEGSVMGTLDYVSPEQAMNAHTVDIRGDLYSLGCTFYFLLTGRVPFPGGTAMEKLSNHAFNEPTPVEQLRKDMPPGVAAVVHKLMAKKPEERFQMPAELATVLAQGAAVPVSAIQLSAAPSVLSAPVPFALAIPVGSEETLAVNVALPEPNQTAGKRRVLLVAGMTFLLGLCLLSLVFLLRSGKDKSDNAKAVTPTKGTLTSASHKDFPRRQRNFEFFDGKSLEGWEGDKKYWSIQDGTIVGSGGEKKIPHDVFLSSKRKYKDFALRFKTQFKDGKGSGGVRFRSFRKPTKDGEPIAVDGGGAVGPSEMKEYFIVCAGKHFMAQINGKTMMDRDIPELPDEGVIAWQLSGGNVTTVTFKHIEFQDLSEDVPGTPPPANAITLFDGTNLKGWVGRDGKSKPEWKLLDNGAMQATGSDIRTRSNFGSHFLLHVEFRVPYLPDKKGQQRANSGVFVQGRYEVQIHDSFGLPTSNTYCGSIFGIAAPRVNVCKRPMVWQSFDLDFQAPKCENDKKVAPAKTTVLHNGVKIHDELEIIKDNTLGGQGGDPCKPGPILLQYQGSPVEFRNIWLVPGK